MMYLQGNIKVGIYDTYYSEFDTYRFRDFMDNLKKNSKRKSKNVIVTFFSDANYGVKSYFRTSLFDDLSLEKQNDNDLAKNKKKIKYSFIIDYCLACKENDMNEEQIKKIIEKIVLETKTNLLTKNDIGILKHKLVQKTETEVLSKLIKNNPNAIIDFFPGYISEKDAEILSSAWSPFNIKEKTIIKAKLTKNEILNKFSNICKNVKLKDEIERIFNVGNNNNIQGIQYLFNEKDDALRQKSYEVLAYALYAVGRIKEPNYIIVEIDVGDNEIRPLLYYLKTRLKINKDELVYFEFIKNKDNNDPFNNRLHGFNEEYNTFFNIIKENQYINTFGIYATVEAKNACYGGYINNNNLIEKYSFVEFIDKLNKEAQEEYVKVKLTQYNQMDLINDINEVIEYQNTINNGLNTSELDDYILNVLKNKYEKTYRSVYKNITKDMRNGNVTEKLMNMVGLKNLKLAVKELCNKVNFKNLKENLLPATKALNQITQFERNNWILMGVPGTGKSTVAEMLEKIMYQEKIIKDDLIVKYTPSNRNDAVDCDNIFDEMFSKKFSNDIQDSFDKASGGVLVVDEIGHLSDKDKSLLLQLMEDNKKSVAVILCGYEEEAKELLEYNPGFRSRFTHIIKLEPYTNEELYQILLVKLKEKHFVVKKDAVKSIKKVINDASMIRNFGQARFIETLADKLISIHSGKKLKLIDEIMNKNMDINISIDEIYEIDNDDIKELALEDMLGEEYLYYKNKKDSYTELKSLIGCNQIKIAVEEFINKSLIDKIKIKRKIMSGSKLNMNMVFYGAPGTAKTTVARLIGKIMYEKGILKNPNVYDVGASDLVAEYVGNTAIKTKKVFEKAKGGILFIDEAYALANDRAGGFNQEAIDTMIREMENNRSDTMVILAGYKDKMEELIRHNPGFKSRISKFINFPNYTNEELIKIFEKLVNDDKYVLYDKDKKEILRKIEKYLDSKRNEKDFGNGRVCRNILENAIWRQSSRIAKGDNCNINNVNLNDTDLLTLKIEDFEFIDAEEEFDKKENIGFVA